MRWATPQLHDIDALAKMVDPTLNGMYPAKSLSRFADIIALCVQVKLCNDEMNNRWLATCLSTLSIYCTHAFISALYFSLYNRANANWYQRALV